MTHPQVISNLCVIYEFPTFLYKKYINQTEISTFPSSDLKLTKMILCQNHDTPSCHQQTLCELQILLYEKDMEWTRLHIGREGQMDRQTGKQVDSYIPPTLEVGVVV